MKKRSSGLYLVEASFAMVGAALLTMAIIDLVRVYHARQSLRTALLEGVRCLYPTDIGCPAVRSDRKVDPNRYNVWATASDTAGTYKSNYEKFESFAEWIRFPRMTVRPYQVRLDQSEIVSEGEAPALQRFGYRVQGLAFSLLQIKKLPTPDLGSPALDPAFRDALTGGQAISPDITQDISNVSFNYDQLASNAQDFDSRFEVGQVRFVLSSPISYAPSVGINGFADAASVAGMKSRGCLNGPQIRGAEGPGCVEPPQWDSFQNTPSGNFFRTRALFHISGRGKVASGSEGKVTIAVSYTRPDGSRYSRTLGGRTYDHPFDADASFVPRGIRWGDASDLLKDEKYTSYPRELKEYHDVELAVGPEITLTFYAHLTRGSGTADWRGQQLKVFVPHYQVTASVVNCSNVVPSGATNVPCADPSPAQQVDTTKVDLSQRVPVAGMDVLPCEYTKDNLKAAIDAKVAVASQEGWDVELVKTATTAAQCATKSIGKACPPDSWVASDKNGAFKVEDAEAICPLPTDPIEPIKSTWKVVEGPVGRGPEQIIDRKICTESKEEVSERYQVLGEQWIEEPLDPNDKEHLCPEAKLEEESIVPVVGVQNRCGTLERIRDSREDSSRRPLPAGVTWKRKQSFTGTPKIYFGAKPTDPCIVVEELSKEDAGREMICAERATRSVVDGCCARAKGSCRIELAMIGGGSGSGKYDVDFAPAVSMAYNSLSSLHPELSCYGEQTAGCPEIVGIQDTLVSDTAAPVVGLTGKLTIPLYVLDKVPGSSGYVIEDSHKRRLERSQHGS